ncbi:MAG: hypothetical protein OXU51_07555 [Candidatus Poribacteria bacterium]|nr:hypothetical protein [Candidatus Poribacteria bacterium]
MSKLNLNIKATDWNLFDSDGDLYKLESCRCYGGGNYILFTKYPRITVIYTGLSWQLDYRIHCCHRTDPRFYDYQPVYVAWLSFSQLEIKDICDVIKGGIENYLVRNFQKPLIGEKWSRNSEIQVEHPLSLLCDRFHL